MANEEFSNVKTSVWWDLENCPVPSGVDPHAIAQNISSALSKHDYRGPVSISAFGDTHNLPAKIQHALSSTGIALNHVPAGIKDASDKRILVDMLFWAVDNSAPANYLLISGDRDFANALHQLSMRRYNILLAHPTLNIPPSLSGAATIIWLWTSLAKGEDLMPIIKDNKQLDKKSDSNFLTNGVRQGSLEMKSTMPKLKGSLNNSNRGGSLPDFNQANWQLYAQNGGLEQSMLRVGYANREIYSANNTYCPETNLPTSSSLIQNISPICDTRASAPPDSHDVRPLQSLENYNNNRQDSCNDPKYNSCISRTKSNSLVKLSSAPSQTNFTPGANTLPAKVSTHHDVKRSRSLHPTVSCPPQMMPGYPPQARPNCPPQVQARPNCPPQVISNFHMEHHAGNRQNFPADLRANVLDFEKMDISSDSQRSPSIQSGTSSLLRVSQLLPSEQTSKPLGSFEANNPTQIETSRDGIHTSPSRLPPAQRPGPDISHRVHLRILSLAMETLKQNMMAPTEQNLEDCIWYGEMLHIPNFNLRENLDKAVELKDIAVMRIGGGFKIYLPPDSVIWQCVDPFSMHDRYSKELWDELFKFLSSHEGRGAMIQSKSRYDAAQELKKSCLKSLLLGQIIHMLHLAINVKKWLRPQNLAQWSPLSITIGQRSTGSKPDGYQGGSPTCFREGRSSCGKEGTP